MYCIKPGGLVVDSLVAISAETHMLIVGNKDNLDESDRLSSRMLYSHNVLHSTYLVLVPHHEVSHVHFLGVYVLTIDSVWVQSEHAPD